jgi:hypothetical protein
LRILVSEYVCKKLVWYVAAIPSNGDIVLTHDCTGEDALANLSIEKQDGVLQGHIRIRSKTQGIALSLGDK